MWNNNQRFQQFPFLRDNICQWIELFKIFLQGNKWEPMQIEAECADCTQGTHQGLSACLEQKEYLEGKWKRNWHDLLNEAGNVLNWNILPQKNIGGDVQAPKPGQLLYGSLCWRATQNDWQLLTV